MVEGARLHQKQGCSFSHIEVLPAIEEEIKGQWRGMCECMLITRRKSWYQREVYCSGGGKLASLKTSPQHFQGALLKLSAFHNSFPPEKQLTHHLLPLNSAFTLSEYHQTDICLNPLHVNYGHTQLACLAKGSLLLKEDKTQTNKFVSTKTRHYS